MVRRCLFRQHPIQNPRERSFPCNPLATKHPPPFRSYLQTGHPAPKMEAMAKIKRIEGSALEPPAKR